MLEVTLLFDAWQNAITPDGNFAYFTRYTATLRNIVAVNTTTNTIDATINAAPFPFGIAITPDGRYAYITMLNSDYVAVADITANTLTPTAITVGSSPLLIAITPDGNYAYVCVRDINSVAVIDIATNTLKRTIPVGLSPFGIAFAAVSAPVRGIPFFS